VTVFDSVPIAQRGGEPVCGFLNAAKSSVCTIIRKMRHLNMPEKKTNAHSAEL